MEPDVTDSGVINKYTKQDRPFFKRPFKKRTVLFCIFINDTRVCHIGFHFYFLS